MNSTSFYIEGIPAPQGSKAFKGYKNGRGIMVESSKKVRPWRTDVKEAAKAGYQGELFTEPVAINIDFYFPRPKSHYRTGKFSNVLKPNAPQWATSIGHGDLDKLLRSTFDALSYMTGGSVLRDDSLVASVHATKRYADEANPPGAAVQVALIAS